MKVINLLTISTMLIFLIACNNNDQPNDQTKVKTHTEEKVTTIENKVDETTTPIDPEKEKKTSIKVGPNGVSVESNKTDVKINSDSSSVEINK